MYLPSSKKMSDAKKNKVFVKYIDDNDDEVSGYFDEVTETTAGSLIISSGKNKIRIPSGRWLKSKEDRE